LESSDAEERAAISVTGLAADAAGWLAGLPGVLSAVAADARLELTVAASASDGILRAALAAGGHVESVGAVGSLGPANPADPVDPARAAEPAEPADPADPVDPSEAGASGGLA
jgi:hypothetical protein